MNKVSSLTEFRKYYLSEFELYDGEAFITFNIVGIDLDKKEIQVAVTDRGRISVVTYDLMTDKQRFSSHNPASSLAIGGSVSHNNFKLRDGKRR